MAVGQTAQELRQSEGDGGAPESTAASFDSVPSRHRSGHLAVEVTGHPNGLPIFLLHGTPGSRNGPKLRAGLLYRLRVKLISYDRPGYGGSTPHPGRSVAHAAKDVEDIADALSIDQFAVVGRSGGGPHALACAALLADRVIRTAALVSLAPSDAEELNWYGGMNEQNTREYQRADDSELAILANLMNSADLARSNLRRFTETLLSDISDRDRKIVDDVAFRQILRNTYAEALAQGSDGWFDDVMAFRKPWGFDLSKITSPVQLWHGEDDQFSPPDHTRWLASRIPTATARIEPGFGHFEAMRILPKMLSWIVDGEASEPPSSGPASLVRQSGKIHRADGKDDPKTGPEDQPRDTQVYLPAAP